MSQRCLRASGEECSEGVTMECRVDDCVSSEGESSGQLGE